MNTTRGRKQLRAEQFNRACHLRVRLDRTVQSFEEGWRMHVNEATDVIMNWLEREYRLGMNAQRRNERARHPKRRVR